MPSAPTGRPNKAQAIGLGRKGAPVFASQALKGRDKVPRPSPTILGGEAGTIVRPFRACGPAAGGSLTQAVGLGYVRPPLRGSIWRRRGYPRCPAKDVG